MQLTDHTRLGLAPLRFITCGSVDDGKSTLIGRLLVDSKSVLQDQLAGVQRAGETDLALLTDDLSAEREQGITIDVAYRYFQTPQRKFIIGDTPGHEQYTRNMVTAASTADAAVLLVDALKLDWENPQLTLLPQTRRHALLVQLLRVPSIVFAVNKLDAVADPARAFDNISQALRSFAAQAGITIAAMVPVSALKGWGIVQSGAPDCVAWPHYQGPGLLELLEGLPATPTDAHLPLSFAVQWVEKQHDSGITEQGRRIFWGRVGSGQLRVGLQVRLFPGGQSARVSAVLDAARNPGTVTAGASAGIILDREVDLSRGDSVAEEALAANDTKQLQATLAWMDEEPLVPGRTYWALHGHRWVKAKVAHIVHRRNIHTLEQEPADSLAENEIGSIRLQLQEPLLTLPFEQSRTLGALILVDASSHATAGAALVQ
jgi:sulfate adenylyltransferase subunit 1